MIIESALAKSSLAGISKNIHNAAWTIGKQVLERGTKAALDHVLKPALQARLGNFSIIEQALFALDLSETETGALEQFLTSPVFENFVRAVGILAGTNDNVLGDQHIALNEFLTRTLPGKSSASIAALSASILDYVAKVAPDAWQTAAENGFIGKQWSSESVVHALVADHISNTRHQLEQRIASTSASLSEIDTFVERYKRAVHFATSKLRPQALHESPSVPIDDLYVEPQIALSGSDAKPCHRNVLLALSRRSVLLGNPGGGKSTLAGKLCHDVCGGAFDNDDLDVPEVAAQVILRDYAQYQKTKPCSIVDYLELHSNSEFQIDTPSNAFKYLLLSGRILIVFDGLDELIETKDRLTVRSAVEHFSLEYPIAAILVTSREVGYEQAPLDRGQFDHYQLQPFDDEQVGDYAKKWFRYSCSPDLSRGTALATSFLDDSSIVPDIRSNPLMLGLLCNLYRQDGFIPKNRPEVYQRCADLLFTKWDRGRGISVKLPLDHRVRPTMSYLAYWIYSNEELQGGSLRID